MLHVKIGRCGLSGCGIDNVGAVPLKNAKELVNILILTQGEDKLCLHFCSMLFFIIFFLLLFLLSVSPAKYRMTFSPLCKRNGRFELSGFTG